MINHSFLDKLTAKWNEGKFVCVGLDKGDFEFDKNIIDQTFDLVCAYKPQSAFYEASGTAGLESLKKTVQYIKEKAPTVPIILDAKRGDIGNTNEAYAKAIFDDLGVDAVTVHPYLGKEALESFLKRVNKTIFVLVRTSNPGAGEFQDLMVEGKPFYQLVAEHVAKDWNANGNCAVVVGATYPEELKKVREIVGDMPILVPGIGAQGGDLEATIKNGLNSKKQGLIISSSRGIIFAPDPRKATEGLHSQIQEAIKNV
ncbi:MAG: orotidine-5'-phosphate decarboxylase [Patescibacteria group bacterium]|nr:orotidine-5'-phosphate decarboxylase [Patescibacteria group bacterium]